MSLPSAKFPAEATTSEPCDCAYETASQRTTFEAGPPSERLITSAPWSAAQIIPAATCESVPKPLASSTFTGSTLAFHAAPAMPTSLFVVAAATPATSVPCPITESSRASAFAGDEVAPGQNLCREVGDRRDTRVDDRHDDPEGTVGQIPRLGQAERREVRLGGVEERIVRRLEGADDVIPLRAHDMRGAPEQAKRRGRSPAAGAHGVEVRVRDPRLEREPARGQVAAKLCSGRSRADADDDPAAPARDRRRRRPGEAEERENGDEAACHAGGSLRVSLPGAGRYPTRGRRRRRE